jgi:hypothetical protein
MNNPPARVLGGVAVGALLSASLMIACVSARDEPARDEGR